MQAPAVQYCREIFQLFMPSPAWVHQHSLGMAHGTRHLRHVLAYNSTHIAYADYRTASKLHNPCPQFTCTVQIQYYQRPAAIA